MGFSLLKKNTNVEEEDDTGDVLQGYDRLGEDEIKRLQLKLARALVIFVELLHLLIARNRDLLLDVIQERKKGDSGASQHSYSRSFTLSDNGGAGVRVYSRKRSAGISHDSTSSQDGRSKGEESARPTTGIPTTQAHSRTMSANGDDYTVASVASGINDKSEKVRTDSAIAVQSELQRGFISLSKALQPMILGIMGSTETPRWLKSCCQENYFSAYTYRQTKIREFFYLFQMYCATIFALSASRRLLNLVFSSAFAFLVSHAAIGEELEFFPGDDMQHHALPIDKITGGYTKSQQGSVDGTIPPNSPGGSIDSASHVSEGSTAGHSLKSLRSSKSTSK
jgi:hypothetical protein